MTLLVPPTEELLGSLHELRVAQDEALYLQTELGNIKARFAGMSHSLLTALPQMAQLRSRGTDAMRARIVRNAEEPADDFAELTEDAQHSFGELEDTLTAVLAVSEFIVEKCNSVVPRLQQGVWQLREIAAAADAVMPEHWQQRVPIYNPFYCLVDGATQPGAGENWEQVARTHNALLDDLDELKSYWRRCTERREEAETRAAIELRRVSESLAAASHRLSSERLGEAALKFAITGGLGSNKLTGAHAGQIEQLAILRGSNASAAEVHRWWQSLGLSEAEAQAFAKEHCFELAGLMGLPLAVSRVASERALQLALKHPKRAYIAMGFQGTGLTLAKFTGDVRSLHASIRKSRKEHPGLPHQLFLFGRHNDAVTAAVSVGDLAKAKRVQTVVPGMNSSVRGMRGHLAGSVNIELEAQKIAREKGSADPKTLATVALVGYDSPGVISEPFMKNAQLGGYEIARFAEAMPLLTQRREGTSVLRSLNLTSHSYGSTTTAEALKIVDKRVDNFMTIGSAGVSWTTRVNKLNTDSVSGISGDDRRSETDYFHSLPTDMAMAVSPLGTLLLTDPGDLTAPFGRAAGVHNLDPRDLPGVDTVPNYGTKHRVTTHALWTEPGGDEHGYLSAGTPSLKAAAEQLAGVYTPEREG